MSSFRPRTLGEYLQLVWRRRLLLLVVIALVATSAFLVIAGLPDLFQSNASVVVAGKEEDRHTIAARVATLIERINSRSFLEPLIQRHNLYPREVANGTTEVAVNRMRKDIKVDTHYRGDNPETLTISYRNTDPVVAKEVATDLVSTFGKMNEAVERHADERSNQINSELAQIETRLSQLGQQSAMVAARSRAAASRQSAFNAVRAQRVAAESSLETLGDREYALEKQISEQKERIAEQEKLARTAPGDARSGSSYGVLLVRKAELEAQLKDYSSQYTDKNPKIVQTRTQLAEINRQVVQLSTATGQDGSAINSPEARELRSMQRELSRSETELEVTRRELDRKRKAVAGSADAAAAGGSAQLARFASAGSDAAIPNIAVETDKDRLRDRYNALLRQQDDVERARHAQAGLDPGVFQIVDLPSEPRVPAGPDRWKLRLIAMALALIAGFVVVAAVEIPRLAAIRDDRDVRYYLGIPVVAQIPESFTPQERGRARRLLAARTLGLFLLACALVPGLVMILNQLRIFHLIGNRW
jgi:protein tyrosine kinase modulator